MRIAYVCADPGVPVFGRKGCSIHVQEVIRSLRGRGASIELFATRLGGDPPTGLDAVPIHQLPQAPKGEAAFREQFALSANHGLCTALTNAGAFDLIYERHSVWSYAGLEFARDCGIPGLLEVNAPLIEEQRRYRRLVHQTDAQRAVARAFGAASALVAVSDEVGDYLNRHPAVRRGVHVVPNGVDAGRFTPHQPPALPGPPGMFTVGFIGTLKPWHGVPSLIDAFAELHRLDSQVRLLIVGDGPPRNELEAQATQHGDNGAVQFSGAVDSIEVPRMLTSMDVAVAPYPALDDFYFSPLKIFEYMAAGRAVVAAAIGQIGEMITDDVTGLLYPPGDTAALSAALQRLKGDPLLRRRLGTAARRAVMQDHTWDAIAVRILEIAEVQWSAETIAQRID